jgi:hypothetical protein
VGQSAARRGVRWNAALAGLSGAGRNATPSALRTSAQKPRLPRARPEDRAHLTLLERTLDAPERSRESTEVPLDPRR